jgi:hypothetical protein
MTTPSHQTVEKHAREFTDGSYKNLQMRVTGIAATLLPLVPASRNAQMGNAFAHTVIDDYPRVAYALIHGDETAATKVGVLQHAVSWSAAAASLSSGSLRQRVRLQISSLA